MTSVTTHCANAISLLVEDARLLAERTINAHALTVASATTDHLVLALHDIARTLDGARTRLVEDGPDYLDAGWAFVDTARGMLANYSILVERAEAEAIRVLA